jgi:DNA mismatch repair protein MutL
MPIRRLPPETVNRIAAGEVVERPASAIKELVDNAIDAGATRIEVEAHGGGLTRILVADDGTAWRRGAAGGHRAPRDLQAGPRRRGLWDLLRIHTMGFRGEALPSIGSVARLTISSRAKGRRRPYDPGRGRQVGDVAPAAFPGPHGARIEVRDLFYATPARLKFMKSERAEALAITEEIKRQAMANESVGFSLDIDGRRCCACRPSIRVRKGRLARLAALLGRDFQDNAIEIDQEPRRRAAERASRACRPTTAATRPTSTCSSTAGRCATGCCRARCAPPMPTSWPATAIRRRRSILELDTARSTSTSTRPRPRCGSAIRPWCAA